MGRLQQRFVIAVIAGSLLGMLAATSPARADEPVPPAASATDPATPPDPVVPTTPTDPAVPTDPALPPALPPTTPPAAPPTIVDSRLPLREGATGWRVVHVQDRLRWLGYEIYPGNAANEKMGPRRSQR